MPKDHRNPEQVRCTAIHEAGHAFAAHLFGRDVISVRLGSTNQPDNFGSVMLSRPGTFTRKRLHEEVVIALAGQAAEHVFELDVSSGAGVDLTDATAQAFARLSHFFCNRSPAPPALNLFRNQ